MSKESYYALKRIFKEESSLSNYAFSLFQFSQRLYFQCKQEGIIDLYFLSREGQLLKILFEKYCENKSYKIRMHYLLISRRAAVIASLRPLEEEDFSLYKKYNCISLYAFLKSLNLSDCEVCECLKTQKIDKQKLIKDFFNSNQFQKLCDNPIFQKKYEEKRLTANVGIKKNLEQNYFFYNKNKAVVDVGWNGTIQDALFRIIDKEKIAGFYLGIVKTDGELSNRKVGLLFQEKNIYSYEHHNYEYICMADHGATVGYTVDGHAIVENDIDCVLYKNTFKAKREEIIRKYIKIMEYSQQQSKNFCTDYYSEYFHTKMFLSLKKDDKKVLKIAKKNHEDTFLKDGTKKSYWLKKILWQIKSHFEMIYLLKKLKKIILLNSI